MNAGDLVKIETEDGVFEGVLIPRPEMLPKGVVVLKLESGYNVGIDEHKIKSKSVVKEYVPKKEITKTIHNNPDLPTVAILSFGGTISSKIDYKTGGVKADYDASDFVEMCPELRNVANIKTKRVMQIMSEDLDLKTLSEMPEAFKPYLEDDSIDGIVMTCGTDMLHYIAAGLSFMIQNLNKPIVITASQRSIDRGSSDAFMNLSCAVKAAASFDGAEIVTCMHGSSDDEFCLLIKGAKVRKMHTSRRDAFRPINALPLAKLNYPSLTIDEIDNNYRRKKDFTGAVEINSKLSEKVAIVYVYPGVDSGIIDYYIEKGYKGLVIAGTALGHVPTEGDSNLLPALKRAVEKGIFIGIATQTLYGRTHPYVYTNLRKLSVLLGCVYGEDMTPETAYMKLCWLLGTHKSHEKVAELFKENLVGEINLILNDDNFLY
jgi:glutamyl-tRNA(Gln) amidotransferase subunit D